MQTNYPRNYFSDSVRVREYFRKRQNILDTLDIKLSSGEATLEDFEAAIRLTKTEGTVLRALFRQCGIAI